MRIMKRKPTTVYGKVLCYEQRRRLAVKICHEHGMKPTRSNLITVMGQDYYKLESAYRELRDLKDREEPIKKRKVIEEGREQVR